MIINAIKNKQRELLISLAIVIGLLIVASMFMYLLEHSAQPEAFPSMLSSLWWGIDKYLTPLGISSANPITPLGKVLGIFIAVLGVGLFALPAGIIASGFIEEIDLIKEKKRMMAIEEKLKYAFTIEYFVPVKNVKKNLGLSHLPRKWLSANDIQYKMGISMEEIVRVSDYSSNFRLRNVKLDGDDSIGLELIQSNRSYGQCVSKGSPITIINMYPAIQPYFGHFTKGISEIVGANYISNEVYSSLSLLPENAIDLVNGGHSQTRESIAITEQLQLDIKSMVHRDGLCIFFVNAASNDFLMQFNVGLEKGNETLHPAPFFANIALLESWRQSAERVSSAHNLKLGIHTTVGRPAESHLAHFIKQETGCDLLMLHVNCGILKLKAIDYYQYMAEFAEIFKIPEGATNP